MLNSAKEIQNVLTSRGYRTLACGGFVRDHLLKIPYKDIDLVTIATPEQVIDSLKGFRVFPTGIEHGTVTVWHNGYNIEVTSSRKDVECDGRYAKVEFGVPLEEEVLRRDFTINALLMDLNTFEIFDYVNGIADIERKLIRFVGNAEDRIKEDNLRILRGLRFKAVLPDFSLEGFSYSHLFLLNYVSQERITSEFLKILVGDSVTSVLSEGVLFEILPELKVIRNVSQHTPYHEYDVFWHSVSVVNYLKQFKNPILSLAGLLHDIAKPRCKTTDKRGVDHFYGHEDRAEVVIGKICHRLRLSNKDSELIQFLVKNHMRKLAGHSLKTFKKFYQQNKNKFENFDEVVLMLHNLNKADFHASDTKYKPERAVPNIFPNTYLIEAKKIPTRIPISGKEIMEILSLQEGPKIGLIMDKLKNAWENSNYTLTNEELKILVKD